MLVGDKIPLNLVLWDGDTNKYVKAIIRNGKDEIITSPVTVPHNSYGHYYYKNSNLTVPDGSKFISIEYIIYNDPDMMIESSLHERAYDEYEILQAPSQSEINNKLDNLINIVTSHGLNDILVGDAYSDELIGNAIDEELEGYINGDDCVTGYIDSINVVASINDLDNIANGDIS